jgi:hypothetical protein
MGRRRIVATRIDKPCTQEHVKLARGLLQAAEAAFEMTHFRRAIGQAKGLADVRVLFDGSVKERSVDIMLTQFKIACGRNGEEEAKAGHAYDWGECFRVVEASTLAATFGG